MPLLEVKNIAKSFGGLAAVDKLSFSVEEGTILGIIGPNGAGKTTVFNLITGLLRPDEGRVFFQGRDITHVHPHARSHMGLSRTFQVVQPFKNLSVLENVMVSVIYGRKQKAVAIQDAEKRSLALCATVGLSERIHGKPGELTTAGLKKMELARALGANPDLLILDEPMEGLNPVELGEAIALVRQISNRGITIVIIEHVMPVIKDICKHVFVMHQGKKLVEGPFEQVACNPQVIEAYLGEEETEECLA